MATEYVSVSIKTKRKHLFTVLFIITFVVFTHTHILYTHTYLIYDS